MTRMATEDLDEVARSLNSFAIHLLRSLRTVDQHSGLTPARLSALSVLHFGGPRSLGRLARDESVTSPTMSRIVDALCDAGLAERTTHQDNGRIVIVSATRAGSRLMQTAADRRVGVIADALRAVPDRDRRRVVAAASHLGGVVANLRP